MCVCARACVYIHKSRIHVNFCFYKVKMLKEQNDMLQEQLQAKLATTAINASSSSSSSGLRSRPVRTCVCVCVVCVCVCVCVRARAICALTCARDGCETNIHANTRTHTGRFAERPA